MTARNLVLFATLGSFALIIGALAFQYLGGLPPCKMCIWQRWPHLIAIAIGAVILISKQVQLAFIGALAALTTGAIGIYHFGVEQDWWEGPTTCTAQSNTSGLNAEDLLEQILTAPTTRCDDVLWEFLGISMAGWNGLISLSLAIVWASTYRANK